MFMEALIKSMKIICIVEIIAQQFRSIGRKLGMNAYEMVIVYFTEILCNYKRQTKNCVNVHGLQF